MLPNQDFKDLLSELNARGVEFLVIGAHVWDCYIPTDLTLLGAYYANKHGMCRPIRKSTLACFTYPDGSSEDDRCLHDR
jgi:hypothetical protein